jgi:gliding motility-associated-like protein
MTPFQPFKTTQNLFLYDSWRFHCDRQCDILEYCLSSTCGASHEALNLVHHPTLVVFEIRMWRNAQRLLGAIMALLAFGNLVAQHAHADSSAIRFIQNKGQWEGNILFAADIPSGRIFLERDRLTYAFSDTRDLHERMFERKPGEPIDSMLDCHAFSVRFAGAQQPEAVVGEDKLAAYYNYFIGSDPSKWAGEVPLYQQVRYKNLYPGIDFVMYAQAHTIKYDFIVQPGANPDVIQLVYDGLEGLRVEAGELVMRTSLFDIRERRPVAFQQDMPLACAFDLQGKTLGFSFPSGYKTDEVLVIDPTLVFSTFTGSYANNFGFSATYDDNGNLYAGGIAYAQNYPVTVGVFQGSFMGLIDVSITKFSPTGSHLYSTFLGGSDRDQPHSMVTDPFGNLFVFGYTKSNNFPTTSAAYDNSRSGTSDIYVSKISPSGNILMASTYIGGDGEDAYNITSNYVRSGLKYNYGDDARGEIVCDDNGSVYVAACTQSSNFPTTAGAFRQQPSGAQDGVVFKMNAVLSQLIWSTHLGGSGDDAAYSLKVAADYSVFVAGGTASSNFPTTPNTLLTTYGGAIDGFVTHLNSTGTSAVASTYIGTSSYNQCYFIEMDADGDIYVMGQKLGTFPTTPGVVGNGTGGQFIQKINPALNTVLFSVVFGTSNADINIAPTAFLVDVCEYVYVSGWGGATNFSGSTASMPITNDAIQSTTDGSDLYLIVFEAGAVAVDFATYMGGTLSHEHVDGGTSRFSKHAEIYQSVCAGCQGNSDFPTTPGALSASNNSFGCNLACFKMDLELPGIAADFVPVPAFAGCAPHSVQFLNQSTGGIGFTWNFGDPGSGAANTATGYNSSHTFQNPGTYTVMLIANDPNSCNRADTSFRTIQVYAVPQLVLSPDTSFCLGQGIMLQASGGQSYQWSPAIGLSSTTTSTTFANPTGPQTYTVIVSNPGGCADTGQVNIGVLPVPTAVASGGAFICPGDSVQLSATGGIAYQWTDPSSLDNPFSQTPWAHPTQTTIYTVTVTAPNGCTDSDTVSVRVSPVQAIPGPDIDLCIGESTQLNGSGGGTYLWQPPLGLSATNIANPVANPTVTTTYTLTVTDGIGCSHTDSLRVAVHPLPIIDLGPDILVMCENDSSQLQAIGAVNYVWSPPTALSNPNIANPLAFPTSSITYVVTGSDLFGCEDQDTLHIDVLPAPEAVAWGGAIICADSSVQVFSSGGGTYLWSPSNVFDNPTAQNPIATLQQTTDLIVTVQGGNGCRDRDTVRVPVTPTPVAQVLGPDLICKDDLGILLVSGGQTYLWNTGATTPRINVFPQNSTLYTAIAFVDGCPSKPDSLYLVVDTLLPVADFYADPDSGLIPLETTFFNQSTSGYHYIWNFGDGQGTNEFSPSHTYQDTGRFQVRLIVVTENGCRDTAYSKVIVGADFTIYIPNAFTPNGDGLNDYFFVKWIGVKEFHVMLFDRWGLMIYESFDPNFRWDGSLHDKVCQEGVYVYVIEARGYLSEKVKRGGSVTLLR